MSELCTMRISGNTILITGATSGIGLSLARRFHALGNNIVAVGRNREKLSQMEGEMDDLTGYVCDIGDSFQLDELLDKLRAKHPNLNVLINNAGIQYNYQLDGPEGDATKLAYELNVNLLATMRICQGLLPLLRHQKYAAVVNVSSGLAFAPKASAPVYCATKSAVHSFTQSLRYQLEDSSIRVYELIPPLVDTPMTEGRQADKLDVEDVVSTFVRAFKREQLEINIGKVKTLRTMLRVWPSMGYRLLKYA